jgi:hypothetical protein
MPLIVKKRNSRTPLRTVRSTKPVVARLPLDLIAEAQEVAIANGSSVSALIEAGLTDLIKKAKKGRIKAA